MSLPNKESPKTPDRNELGYSAFVKLAPRKYETKIEQLEQLAFISPKVSLAVQAAVDEAVLDHQVSIASNNLLLFFRRNTWHLTQYIATLIINVAMYCVKLL